MSDFEALLKEISGLAEEHSALAKSIPEGSAAGDGGQNDKPVETAAAGEGDDLGEGGEGEDEGSDGALVKSMVIDGETVDVIDAEQLVKSVAGLEARMDAQGDNLVKSIEPMLQLIKGQGELIKSMNARIESLAGQGRGRKTVLTVMEKPSAAEPLRKSLPEQPSGPQILAKALDAQRAGKISGIDVARAENAIQSGHAVPADVLARI